MRTLSPDHARRIALTAMGLHRPRPGPGTRRDVRHFRRVLDTVDVVQIDSVNVLARAHELPFWSRIGPHDRAARDRWLWRSGELFEGWVHAQSLTHASVWPLLHHRRSAARPGRRIQGLLERDPHYLDRVLAEVAGRGPTSVADLSDPGRRTGPWWGSPRGKVALDWLAYTGELAIHDRTPQFMTRYDLPQRVLPPPVLQTEPPPEPDAIRRLLLRAARTHGIGTAADLADHHRLRVPVVRPALEALVGEGRLERVAVRGWWQPAYRDPAATAARTFPARALLSPFDPLVWNRDRTERLFGFRYRIEIYVPGPQRVHGYYVLPFLLGEHLVARVDLKADRQRGRLLVRGAFAEEGVDRIHVARELAVELTELSTWLELPEVGIEDRGDLVSPLRRFV